MCFRIFHRNNGEFLNEDTNLTKCKPSLIESQNWITNGKRTQLSMAFIPLFYMK